MARGIPARRVVRKLDTWSVCKVALLFYLSLVSVVIVAGVLLWSAGSTVGAVDSAEKFMRGIGFEDFRFVGSQLLQASLAAGLVVMLLGTVMTVLMAVIYNLISDIVGGVQLTVLEEGMAPGPEAAGDARPVPLKPGVSELRGGPAAEVV